MPPNHDAHRAADVVALPVPISRWLAIRDDWPLLAASVAPAGRTYAFLGRKSSPHRIGIDINHAHHDARKRGRKVALQQVQLS